VRSTTKLDATDAKVLLKRTEAGDQRLSCLLTLNHRVNGCRNARCCPSLSVSNGTFEQVQLGGCTIAHISSKRTAYSTTHQAAHPTTNVNFTQKDPAAQEHLQGRGSYSSQHRLAENVVSGRDLLVRAAPELCRLIPRKKREESWLCGCV
jgi:hypothetical protein